MYRTIVTKEIKLFFRSPFGLLLGGIFSLLAGWMFFNLLVFFTENVQRLPEHIRTPHDFSNTVIVKLLGSLNFLFMIFVPILSMGIFSQEYRNKTIDLYYSSPVSDYSLVLAKQSAVIIQGLFLLVLTLVFPFLIANLGLNDYSFIIIGYIGLILNIICYSIIGVFASSLSANMIIAGIVSLVLSMFFWMFSWTGSFFENYFLVKILNFLSLSFHFQNFIRGYISILDISFYLSFFGLFTYMTLKKIESRKWQ